MSEKIYWKDEKELPPMAVSLGTMRWNKTASWRTMRPVINYEKCIKCMICWKYCPEPAILIEDDKPVIDYEYCKGCGICAVECPKDAIDMVREGR